MAVGARCAWPAAGGALEDPLGGASIARVAGWNADTGGAPAGARGWARHGTTVGLGGAMVDGCAR